MRRFTDSAEAVAVYKLSTALHVHVRDTGFRRACGRFALHVVGKDRCAGASAGLATIPTRDNAEIASNIFAMNGNVDAVRCARDHVAAHVASRYGASVRTAEAGSGYDEVAQNIACCDCGFPFIDIAVQICCGCTRYINHCVTFAPRDIQVSHGACTL